MEELDKEIVKNYRLWPTNYIALDLLNQSEEHKHHYSVQEKGGGGGLNLEARMREGVAFG